ncbi:uncharacterized protein LOC117502400 [Thalassophryne amazonica]|uniref:uncharacterized protein LOC117502400 n=1 Tax=Thalassophryne amazonica TaxID=390379 RepID=UPI0014724484|nr:uncharacterized protein LOC117502400 [Thalassophryne amazonica]
MTGKSCTVNSFSNHSHRSLYLLPTQSHAFFLFVTPSQTGVRVGCMGVLVASLGHLFKVYSKIPYNFSTFASSVLIENCSTQSHAFLFVMPSQTGVRSGCMGVLVASLGHLFKVYSKIPYNFSTFASSVLIENCSTQSHAFLFVMPSQTGVRSGCMGVLVASLGHLFKVYSKIPYNFSTFASSVLIENCSTQSHAFLFVIPSQTGVRSGCMGVLVASLGHLFKVYSKIPYNFSTFASSVLIENCSTQSHAFLFVMPSQTGVRSGCMGVLVASLGHLFKVYSKIPYNFSTFASSVLIENCSTQSHAFLFVMPSQTGVRVGCMGVLVASLGHLFKIYSKIPYNFSTFASSVLIENCSTQSHAFLFVMPSQTGVRVGCMGVLVASLSHLFLRTAYSRLHLQYNTNVSIVFKGHPKHNHQLGNVHVCTF